MVIEGSSEEITLRDVLEAVEDDESIFCMHEHPSPECPVGRNVHAVLGAELNAAETAMLERLASTTLADLADETRELIQQQENLATIHQTDRCASPYARALAP